MHTFQLIVVDPYRRRTLHFLCREDREYSNLLNCKFLNSDPPSPEFTSGEYYTIVLPDTFTDCVIAQLPKPNFTTLGLLDYLFYPINDIVIAVARVVEHFDKVLGHVHVLVPVAPREAVYTVMARTGQVARGLGLYTTHSVVIRRRKRTRPTVVEATTWNEETLPVRGRERPFKLYEPTIVKLYDLTRKVVEKLRKIAKTTLLLEEESRS